MPRVTDGSATTRGRRQEFAFQRTNPQRCVGRMRKLEVKFRLGENQRMRPSGEHLDAAFCKVNQYQRSQWVGHLTPAQAHALVDAGAIAAHHDIAWMKSGLQAARERDRSTSRALAAVLDSGMQLNTLFALANLWMVQRTLTILGGKVRRQLAIGT